MEMPMLDVLREKNVFSGCEGPFRFKAVPDGETVNVVAYQAYCLEYCRENGLVLGEEAFPLTEEGMVSMEAWLCERRAACEG